MARLGKGHASVHICARCTPSVEKVPSSWGLAWPSALARCPRLLEEFLRGMGWVDNVIKNQTRFLGLFPSPLPAGRMSSLAHSL